MWCVCIRAFSARGHPTTRRTSATHSTWTPVLDRPSRRPFGLKSIDGQAHYVPRQLRGQGPFEAAHRLNPCSTPDQGGTVLLNLEDELTWRTKAVIPFTA